MAEISKFKVNGTEYDIKDATARQVATATTKGIVGVDNKTVFVDENGILSSKGGGGGVPVGDVSGATISTAKEVASLTWSDPDDVVLDGTTIAAWKGTLVLRKEDSAPANEEDGTVIADVTTKNQHSVNPLEDNTIEYGKTYYYRFFPYTDREVFTAGTSLTSVPVRETVQIPVASGMITYDGDEHTASFTNYDDTKMDARNISGTEAGTYGAVFAPKRDYMWPDGSTGEQVVFWEILRRPVNTPTISGTYTYDGTEQSASISAYDTELIAQSGDDTGTNAGTYTVTFSLVDKHNYMWIETSQTSDRDVSWTIDKAAGGATLSSDSVTLESDHPAVNVSISNPTGEITGATSSDDTVATVQLNEAKTIAIISNVDETSGTATITLSIAESSNYLAASVEIAVSAEFSQIYGAEWDGTSTTAWSRTDAAVGFVDPVPYVAGASSYSSPFDNIQPWAGMVKEERTGGTMVKIPKFWYKITQNGLGLKIQIADGEQDGFSVSPAHMDRGDGKGERDAVYVGRYHCGSSGYKSTSGQTPYNNVTRSNARTNLHNLGNNLWQMDFATRFTIWLLYIVEFADWNSQAKIGYGCGNNSGVQSMGYTDSMPYHTGTTQGSRTTYGLGTQYRNIEGLWDNVYDWLDGCYYNSNGLNIILNPSNFSDSANGIAVGVPSSGYPSKFSLKEVNGTYPLFIPTEASGSDSTFSCDGWYFDASYPCLCAGGGYGQSQGRGLFYVGRSGTSYASADLGCRLLELP